MDIKDISNQLHYTKDKIQVMEFCRLNGYTWTQSNIIKYVTRFSHKDGIKDLYKALDYLKCEIYFFETGEFLPPNKLTINEGKVVKQEENK